MEQVKFDLKLEILDVEKDVCCCNNCERGELLENGIGMKFPYKKVVSFIVGYFRVCLCYDCYKEFVKSVRESEGDL